MTVEMIDAPASESVAADGAQRQSEPGRKVSLARQVADDLLRQIESGALAPGDRLPLREDLCRQYGVSSITIRAAVADLMAKGRLESKRRGGIFVKANIEQDFAEPSQTIALVAELATNPFSATILAGAAERAAIAGYRVALAGTNDDPEVEARQIEELADKVLGTLVIPVNHTESHASAFARVLARNGHLVFVDHYIEGISAPRVTSDNVRGGYLATRHLLECGCAKVYAITSGNHTTSSRERLTGHLQALQEHGHLFDPSLILHSPDVHFEAGRLLTREILERESRSKKLGIFAINDVVAAGAYVSIKQAGLRIPDDVAVVGYDDIHGAMMDPPLTSVRQDLLEMGRSAMQTLLNLIGGKTTEPILVPVELVVRASTVGYGDERGTN